MPNSKNTIIHQGQPLAQRKASSGGFFGSSGKSNYFFEPIQKKSNNSKPIQRVSAAGVASDVACATLSDEQLYAFFRNVYFANQPNARRHITHYRTGGGAVYTENVAALFADNPRIALRVASLISSQFRGEPNAHGTLLGGGDDGRGGDTPPIRQSDYDSEDWRNANGNVDEIQWRLVGQYNPSGANRFEITVIDPYTWHEEEGRPTQCIHAAMVRLKQHGAADYITQGTAIVTLTVSPFNDTAVSPAL